MLFRFAMMIKMLWHLSLSSTSSLKFHTFVWRYPKQMIDWLIVFDFISGILSLLYGLLFLTDDWPCTLHDFLFLCKWHLFTHRLRILTNNHNNSSKMCLINGFAINQREIYAIHTVMILMLPHRCTNWSVSCAKKQMLLSKHGSVSVVPLKYQSNLFLSNNRNLWQNHNKSINIWINGAKPRAKMGLNRQLLHDDLIFSVRFARFHQFWSQSSSGDLAFFFEMKRYVHRLNIFCRWFMAKYKRSS